MKKILIIEDDAIAAMIYKKSLDKAGYVVEVATDGQSGLDRMAEFMPDGLLLDLMLPKVNGIEILKAARSQATFQNCPIFVYTNAFVGPLLEQARRMGATDMFDKTMLTPTLLTQAFRIAFEKASSSGQ